MKGAFTGADHAALGCFRAADKGTIFLDEIGELDRDLQAKLLRVLQQRDVTPLGSYATVPVDVRVIAATNCELEQMVAVGRFREDLYYRLNVVNIRTIPLKDRPEDILPLAQYFLEKMASHAGTPVSRLSCRCSGLHAAARLAGQCSRIGELPGTSGRALCGQRHSAGCRSRGRRSGLHLSHCGIAGAPRRRIVRMPLSNELAASAAPANAAAGTWPTLDQIQREHIQRTLQQTGNNHRHAADLLGIHRQQLLRKIRKYGLDSSPSRCGRPKKAR